MLQKDFYALSPPLPSLATRTRARLLNCYANAAEYTKAESILIGGAWKDNKIFMENQVAQLNLHFQLCTNEHLCLLAHTPDCRPVKCFALDTDGPYSLMGIWDSSRSAEQPAPRVPDVEPPAPHQGSSNSVGQPAPRVPVVLTPAVKLVPSTPLYDNLIANLELAVTHGHPQHHPSGTDFMNYMESCCFFGNLLSLDRYGEPIDIPVPLSIKMEELLRAAQEQRDLQLQRLMERGVQRTLSNDMHMHPVHDMKEIYNTWRHDVESWMTPSTLDDYQWLLYNQRNQEAHLLGKQAFSTYLFQLSGCKFLLHKLIELPLISASSAGSVRSAERPAAILNDLLNAYDEHKRSPEYQQAVQKARKHQEGQLALSRRVWWAQYNYSHGRKLSLMVKNEDVDYFDLEVWEDPVFMLRNEILVYPGRSGRTDLV